MWKGDGKREENPLIYVAGVEKGGRGNCVSIYLSANVTAYHEDDDGDASGGGGGDIKEVCPRCQTISITASCNSCSL